MKVAALAVLALAFLFGRRRQKDVTISQGTDSETGTFTQETESKPKDVTLSPTVAAWDPSWEDGRPLPGHFYQVRRGDAFLGRDGIAGQAIYNAALAAGASDAQARWLRDRGALRLQYLDAILCSGWNDALYGTWGFGRKAHAGPHGRSIRLLPMHADNRARIIRGEPPLRNIQLQTPADTGKGTAKPLRTDAGRAFEYLWLPPLDPDALEQGVIQTEGIAWDNGDPGYWPPPDVTDLGVAGEIGLTVSGCKGGALRHD